VLVVGLHVELDVVQMVAWCVVAADLTDEAGVKASGPVIPGGAGFDPLSVMLSVHGAAAESVYVELV
jgi:hypothetical protein